MEHFPGAVPSLDASTATLSYFPFFPPKGPSYDSDLFEAMTFLLSSVVVALYLNRFLKVVSVVRIPPLSD